MLYVVAGSYILASLTLYIYPSILHKTKDVSFPSRFIAHRGGGGERIENSLVSFQRAVDLKADLLELDVQLTKDGEVLICHDNDLSRVCGQNLKISNLLLKDVPLMLKEMPVACEPDDTLVTDVQQPLFRLEDLYKTFPHVPMHIDVKDGGDELINKVNELTKQYNRERITVWGAFSHSFTTQCRETNSTMLTFCSMIECAMYGLLLIIGLLPWIPIKGEFYHVPIATISCKSGFLSTFPHWLNVFASYTMCNRFLLWHLHRRGIRTGAWVMNHPHEFKAADDCGFYGIMTDYPSRLVAYEAQRTKLSQD